MSNRPNTTFPCILCNVQGRLVICQACNSEVQARQEVLRYEALMVTHQINISNLESNLREARRREATLTQDIAAARNGADILTRQRTLRTNRHAEPSVPATPVTTPIAVNRGREREETQVEIVGPPGSTCPPGWQSRRLRARPASTEPRRPEAHENPCGICLEVPLSEPVEARCRRMNCTFQSCLPCWTEQHEHDARCPQCRMAIINFDDEDSE
jgi:hypothetical protein